MPFVKIQLKEGRTAEQKAEVAKKIIEMMEALDFAQADQIRVIYEDMKDEDYYNGANYYDKK